MEPDSPMIYRRFGRTGLNMPVLSFGCMRSMYAWPDTPEKPVPAEAQRHLAVLVETALSHGITHIETAHGYGSSERQLGAILPRIPRNDYLLQTKVVPCADPEEFAAKVRLSLQRLQVQRLDLLALHGINDFRSLWYACRKDGCLAAARRLQERGLIDFIGFSGHAPLEVILQALAHDEDGGFDYLNAHWYYILDVNRPAIELAASKDLGVFIISPTDKGGRLFAPSSTLVRCCGPLSPMLFNDLYCLSHPGVCTISIGASQPAHFTEHLQVLPLLQTEQSLLLAEIDGRLRREMKNRTGHERPDALWSDLPSWDQSPGTINLPMTVWLYQLLRGWAMRDFARSRYRDLGQGSSWVPGNTADRVKTYDFKHVKTVTGLHPQELKALLIAAHRALR